MDPENNPEFNECLESLEKGKPGDSQERIEARKLRKLSRHVSMDDRGYAIQKIFSLHHAKEYKNETLFSAINIFDRYLRAVGHWKYQREKICLLATVSLLIAAKMQEKIAPNFLGMLSLLEKDEQEQVDLEMLLELEAKVLVTLGFDFGYPMPTVAMERYLHLLEYDHKALIHEMAYEIMKFALNDS